jgi:hypothetical protein
MPADTVAPRARAVVTIPDALRVLLASQFTSDQLRHLAALMELDSPGLRARQDLDEASVVELAAMVVAGKIPTVGWWRRQRPTVSPEHFLQSCEKCHPTSGHDCPEVELRELVSA